MQHLKTATIKSTLESNSSLLFLQEIKIEEVEEVEENLIRNKSKYFFVKNNTSFFYKNLIENNLLSIKEEVLFQNFITTSSFIRLYKRFQVYKI
jgi:Leucine-rich repeat (LRR) protein